MRKEKLESQKNTNEIQKIDLEFLGENEPEKGNFLENPLPVPKKHIKKTMDFSLEPKEEQLKYDVIIPDYDDFDV
jgi:hypothetical protein